jgi:hypothetical protein
VLVGISLLPPAQAAHKATPTEGQHTHQECHETVWQSRRACVQRHSATSLNFTNERWLFKIAQDMSALRSAGGSAATPGLRRRSDETEHLCVVSCGHKRTHTQLDYVIDNCGHLSFDGVIVACLNKLVQF